MSLQLPVSLLVFLAHSASSEALPISNPVWQDEGRPQLEYRTILTGAVTQNGKRMNAPVSISSILSYIE